MEYWNNGILEKINEWNYGTMEQWKIERLE
jgi:hypothetical protein